MALSGPTLLTADPDTSNVSSYVTPSVSPSANALIIVGVWNTDGTNAVTPTLSSGFTISGSWTQKATIQAAAATRRLTIFEAQTGGSPGSGTITADFGGDSQTGCIIEAVEFTGHDTTTPTSQYTTDEGGGAGATSLTLTLGSALSSADDKILAFIGHNTNEDQTAGSGATELASSDVGYNTPTARMGVYHETNDNVVSASWTTSSAKLAAGCEVNAGGTTLSPASITHTRAMGSPTVSPQIVVASIVHTRAMGSPTVTSGSTLSPASIVHTRAMGGPTVSPQIVVGSITHTRAMGTPTLHPSVVPGSIVHTRAMGDILVATGVTLTPASIVHTRAMGSPTVSSSIVSASIVHTRAMGDPRVGPQILIASIVHARAMGIPTIDDGLPDAPGSWRDDPWHHHGRSRR